MKYFKYAFLIVGIIYLIEAVYAFVEPSEVYKIFSFEVSLWGYVLFKVLIGAAFLYAYKKELDKEKMQ